MNKNKTYPIAVIGLGLGGPAASPISEALLEVIKGADCICAGSKQLEEQATLFPPHLEKLPVTGDVPALVATLRDRQAQGKKIVALTGGDPLFFGLGSTLSRYFSPKALRIYPGLSALQEACARLALPWDKMRFVSLHGRSKSHESPWLALARAIMSGHPVCLLLDATITLALVADFLLDRGCKAFTMHYFRGLQKSHESELLQLDGNDVSGGSANLEQHFSLRPEEAAHFSTAFSMLPSMLILTPNQQRGPRPYLGMPDEVFECQDGLLTKQPVRAAILGALRLHPEHTLLDLGAGSGSVAIEAAALLPEGGVYAVERQPERVEQIKNNRRRHGAANLEIIQSDSRLLLGHPDFRLKPQRIFIGGGLDKSMHLLRLAWAALPPGGRLVISCVLLGTLERSRHMLREFGAQPEITCIQAARSAELAEDLQLKAYNPVFIIAADKVAGAGAVGGTAGGTTSEKQGRA